MTTKNEKKKKIKLVERAMTISGQPILEPNGKEMTIRDILTTPFRTQKKGDENYDEAIKNADLFAKIQRQDEVEFTSDEIVVLKQKSHFIYDDALFYSVCAILGDL